MPKGDLIVHRRVVEADGSLVEIKVWQVPKNPRQPHGFKYSLVYIVERQRVLGYDNAHGRDHRHVREKGYPYTFNSSAALVEDFLRDLADIREGQV
jgi:Family of unknown function (DUF6516)